MHPEYTVIDSDVTKIRQIDYFQFDIKVNKPSPPGYQSPGETGNVTRHKGQASALILAPIIIFLVKPLVQIIQKDINALNLIILGCFYSIVVFALARVLFEPLNRISLRLVKILSVL